MNKDTYGKVIPKFARVLDPDGNVASSLPSWTLWIQLLQVF